MEVIGVMFFSLMCVAFSTVGTILIPLLILAAIAKRFTYGSRQVEVVITRPGERYDKQKRAPLPIEDETGDGYFIVGADGTLLEVVRDEDAGLDPLDDMDNLRRSQP